MELSHIAEIAALIAAVIVFVLREIGRTEIANALQGLMDAVQDREPNEPEQLKARAQLKTKLLGGEGARKALERAEKGQL